MSNYTLEKFYRIWNDQDGSRLEIGPDSDSIGLIEIRRFEPDGKVSYDLVINKDQATLLQACLVEAVADTTTS